MKCNVAKKRVSKKTPLQLEFGKRVQSKRKAIGFTQEELAEKADLSLSYLSSIECGERNVSLGNIIGLADALSMSPKELLPEHPSDQKIKRAKADFGKRLSTKRKAAGCTCGMLAERTGLETGYIELLEHGGGTLNYETLIIIAEALRIPPKELIP